MKILGKYFPAPAFLQMTAAGLDISDYYIKYVELVRTHRGVGVARYGKKEVPKGAIEGGVIKDPAQIVSILKEIKQELKTNFVHVGLPEEHVFSFHLKIPRVPANEITSAIEFQLEEHVPVAKEELVFDYDLITQGRHMFHIQVHAATKKILESYEKLFEESHLRPVFFELESQANMRAIVLPEDKQDFIVVDIGKARSNISIIRNHKVLATVTTSTSGDKLTQALMNSPEGDFSAAEQKKVGLDLVQEDAKSSVKQELRTLNKEIEKYFAYWKSTAPELLVVQENKKKDKKNKSKTQEASTAKETEEEQEKAPKEEQKETEISDEKVAEASPAKETSKEDQTSEAMPKPIQEEAKKDENDEMIDENASPEEVANIMDYIVVCGGGSNMKGLPEFMSEELHSSVEKATTWNAPDLKGNKLKIPENEVSGYTAAIGLALGNFNYD